MARNKKTLLVVSAVVLGVALTTLILLPMLFAGPVEARVRAEVERAARLQVDWSDVGLDLLGDFPNPRLTLSGLTVVGTGSFEGDTLAAVEDLRVALGAASVVRSLRGRGALEVRSVEIEAPRIRLRVDENGVASWSVLPDEEEAGEAAAPEEAAETGRGLQVSLRSFELSDGSIVYDDASTGLFLSLEGLRHTLRGDFSREALVAATEARADAVTLRFAGAPYLAGVSMDFAGDFDVDMAGGEARLVENRLGLNDLVVHFDGVLARSGENLEADLTFAAPSTDFGEILSLVPVVYANDFASLETAGTFALEGSVQGPMGVGTFPSFALELDVADGRFRYPDLPLPAEEIAAGLSVSNPGGGLDSTVVDLSRFHARIGAETFEASARVTTPVSDPSVALQVDGTLDLGDLARTVKLPQAEGLSGVVVADAAVRARRSDVDSARWERVDARGTISARDVALPPDLLRHPVAIHALELTLTPRTAELGALDAEAGSSDIRASGRLDNLLGFALGGGDLTGSGSFESRRVVLDEWRSGEDVDAIPVPPRLDMELEGTIDALEVNGLELSDARGRAVIRDRRLTFEGFRLQGFGGRIALDGHYETLDPARPTFAVTVGLDSLDIGRASSALASFRALAPVAAYARGTFSTDLALSGALGQDLSLDLTVLNGDGSFATSPVAVEGFPLLQRLAERLELSRLSNPTVDAVRSSIRIQGGRLVVDPFQTTLGGLGVRVAGSNGIDQSIDYGLTLQIPRAGLAATTLDALGQRAGPLADRLAAVDTVPVQVRVTGLVRDPSFDIGLADLGRSARTAVTDAAAGAAQQRIDDARAQADSVEAEARRRAQARADSVVAAAERQAETIRAEAARAAAEIRAQGDRAAEELLSRASNPLERVAAERAAARVRQEADQRAAALESEADARATQLVEEARERAEAILAGTGSDADEPVP